MTHHDRPEAWVTLVAEDDVRTAMGDRRLPYEAYLGGVIPRMSRLLASHDLIGAAFRAVASPALFGPGALSRAEREMVAVVAAAAQHCHYFTHHHTAFFRAEGGDPALAEAIRAHRWQAVASLTERQRALCLIAEKLSGTPTRIGREDWQPLRHLGFDDRACLEVAHVVCLFNYLIRLAEGFGLQPTEAKAHDE